MYFGIHPKCIQNQYLVSFRREEKLLFHQKYLGYPFRLRGVKISFRKFRFITWKLKTILVNEKLILHKENLTLFQYKKEQSILAKLPSKRIKRKGGRKKEKFFVHWETKSFISHFHFPSFFIRKCTLKCIQSWVGSSFCLNSDCWLFWSLEK